MVDPDGDVAAAKETVLDALGRSAEVYGLKRSYGRLWGELLFATEPLSLDELAERSEYAKSTVSTAMSAMERFHLVHRKSIPGEGKKAYYEAEEDFWHVFQQFLDGEVRREIGIMQRALDEAAAELEAADEDVADEHLETVAGLQDMYDRSERAVNVLTSESVDRVVGMVERLGGE
ncbi:MAG: GbsR/MarR family transcriptional regulator [Haloglomus sp.]